MVKIEEHKQKIQATINEISSTKSYKRKQDLKRSLHRLRRELRQCLKFMGESGVAYGKETN